MGFFDNSITDTIQSYNELSKVIKKSIADISNSIQFDTNDFKRSTQKNLDEINSRITDNLLKPYGQLAATLNFYIEVISILVIALLIVSILCKIKQLFSSTTNNHNQKNKNV